MPIYAFQQMFDTPDYTGEMPQLQGSRTAKEIVQDLVKLAGDKGHNEGPPIYNEVQKLQGWDPHNKETSPATAIVGQADLIQEWSKVFDHCYAELENNV